MQGIEKTESSAYQDLFDLHGQVALVTGAARGLGRGIADRLAELGAHVIIADVNAELASASVEELGQRGLKADFVLADLMNEASINDLVAQVVSQYGNLHIVVNNAGIYPYSPVVDMETSQWDNVLNLDLRAPFLLSRAAAKHMIDNEVAGTIVNVSSMNAFRSPFAGVSHYDAAKAGLVAFTRSLAIELGHFGIRVNAVAPGLNLTEGQREAFGMSPEAGVDAYPRFYQAWLKRIPLGRVGTPDDQAKVVAFLVSGAAAYITGQCLIVDGGAILV